MTNEMKKQYIHPETTVTEMHIESLMTITSPGIFVSEEHDADTEQRAKETGGSFEVWDFEE